MRALFKHIDFLRAQAIAPLSRQGDFAREVEQLPRLGVGEAGDVAAMLASSARAVSRQVHRASPQTQEILRDVLKRLSDALQSEADAHGLAPEIPYYVER